MGLLELYCVWEYSLAVFSGKTQCLSGLPPSNAWKVSCFCRICPLNLQWADFMLSLCPLTSKHIFTVLENTRVPKQVPNICGLPLRSVRMWDTASQDVRYSQFLSEIPGRLLELWSFLPLSGIFMLEFCQHYVSSKPFHLKQLLLRQVHRVNNNLL